MTKKYSMVLNKIKGLLHRGLMTVSKSYRQMVRRQLDIACGEVYTD